MSLRSDRSLAACLTILLGACTTSNHGSFITSSYQKKPTRQDATLLGAVEGRSCQTQILYLFPSGDKPTTDDAIRNAKSTHEDTRFLVDISIDDETRWKFGYSIECIVVHATAYGHEEVRQ